MKGDDGIVYIINARSINRGIFFHICSSASFSECTDILLSLKSKTNYKFVFLIYNWIKPIQQISILIIKRVDPISHPISKEILQSESHKRIHLTLWHVIWVHTPVTNIASHAIMRSTRLIEHIVLDIPIVVCHKISIDWCLSIFGEKFKFLFKSNNNCKPILTKVWPFFVTQLKTNYKFVFSTLHKITSHTLHSCYQK